MSRLTLSGSNRLIVSGVAAAVIIGGLAMASALWHHKPAEKGLSATATIVDYQSEARAAVSDYEAYIRGDVAADGLSRRREQLLSLTVKTEDRNLHLRLVQIADMLAASKATGAVDLQKLYDDYPWLKS